MGRDCLLGMGFPFEMTVKCGSMREFGGIMELFYRLIVEVVYQC